MAVSVEWETRRDEQSNLHPFSTPRSAASVGLWLEPEGTGQAHRGDQGRRITRRTVPQAPRICPRPAPEAGARPPRAVLAAAVIKKKPRKFAWPYTRFWLCRLFTPPPVRVKRLHNLHNRNPGF